MHDTLEALAAIAAPVGGELGVAAHSLETGERIEIRAEEPFPLASVFKVPVMVAVLRAVDAGLVALDERLDLREADKSPGGPLIFCHADLQPTVRDLLLFMITLSDNTATDLLWRRIGMAAVNHAMEELGLNGIDCFMPGREFFLIEAGFGSDWAGIEADATVRRWRELAGSGRLGVAYRRLLEEAQELDGSGFQRLYDERWGGGRGWERAAVVDPALDNSGTPRDLARLLAMIAQDECASPASCALMREILRHQEWRDRIPAGLPEELEVGNKTGSVAGTINDVAIVAGAAGGRVVLALLWKGLDRTGETLAPAAIGAAAGVLWRRLAAG
jgi:beta-lactamase class A